MSIIIGLLGISKYAKSLNPRNIHLKNLSRRSNNAEAPYKVIKSKKSVKEEDSGLVWRDPNFEILASPSGFPFFLPGNVSPAWYDKNSTIRVDNSFVMEQITKVQASDNYIVCRVQDCPAVLRQTVCDLFPASNLELSELSVITITLKPNIKLLRTNKEIETEKLAQTFVITANNICDKLKQAGYWADFINPFSGRPYSFPIMHGNTLYETDEKFRCLDFQISEFNECKVIAIDQDKSKKMFIGSLFTNAPSNKCKLNTIFTHSTS